MVGTVGLETRRKHVLWLQWLLVIAVSTLLYFSDPEPHKGLTALLILGIITVNSILQFLPHRVFQQPEFDYALVFFDIFVLAVALYHTRQAESEFYLFFFIIIIIAATVQNLTVLLAGVLAISGVYTAIVLQSDISHLSPALLLRIPFLFIVGIFFGYLVHLRKQETGRAAEESAFTFNLFEFGRALAGATDLEALYQRIPPLINPIMGTDVCELVTVEKGRIRERSPFGSLEKDSYRIPIEESIHRMSFESEAVFTCERMDSDPHFTDKKDYPLFPYRAYMGTSWKIHEHPAGVLAVFRSAESPWTDHDRRKFQFLTGQAVLAFQYTQLLQELESLARTDGLTGLSNYRYFHERLEEEFIRASRTKRSLSVLMIDVDHLKEINDIQGHSAGDAVLCHVGDLIRQTARRTDIAARIGGDEFALMLPETDENQVDILSSRLLEAIRSHKREDLPAISISMGSATFPKDAAGKDELLQHADETLYQAKALGRGRAHPFAE